MKALHDLPVGFAYLLSVVVGVEGVHQIVNMGDGLTVWASASSLVSGLLSLGLAYFLWRWAGSVRANARTKLDLAERARSDLLTARGVMPDSTRS